MSIYEKIEKSIRESKFVHHKKFKRLPSDQWPVLFFFQINFLNLKKTKKFFWSIIYMWFLIIGNYTLQKINHNNRIDCPKYLNKNQALFRHKSQMTDELYFMFWAFRQPGKTGHNWPPTPNSASDKVFTLNFHSTILCNQSDFVIHFSIWACTLIIQ